MFKFRKIASVLASAIMVSSTVALAAAANYPDPFVKGGVSDVAIVYGGSDALNTDLVAAAEISTSLQENLAKQTATTSTSASADVSGEAYPLFSSGKKIYLNDSINKEVTLLSASHLPAVLKDGTFEGDVSATYTQKIDIWIASGQNDKLVYGRHPTDDSDPTFAVKLSTLASSAAYNLTVTFNKAVAFNHSDSEGEELSMFGQKFTVGAATDGTNLILLRSSQKLFLTSDEPTATVTIDGKEYKIELISSSDTAANVKVTNSDGKAESKEIGEDASKSINGIEVGVTAADETNFKLSATVTVGANRIKLADNAAVKIGTEETTVDGTNVRFGDGQVPSNITKLIFQISAEDTDVDAVSAGGDLKDPVFGSVKLAFPSLNIPENSSSREDIVVQGSGADKATIKFKSWDGTEAKTVEWFYNKTDGHTTSSTRGIGSVLADSNGNNINVIEMAQINKSELVVVGNENNGGLWKLKTVSNDSSTPTKSTVEFENVMTGAVQKSTISSDGSGTVDLGSRTYTVTYRDSRVIEGDETVRLAYPDGSRTTAGNYVVYPTIQTGKGAKLAFYAPMNITLSNGDGSGTDVAALKFPDGDGYTTVNIAFNGSGAEDGRWNVTVGSTVDGLNTSGDFPDSVSLAIGQLTYNLTSVTSNSAGTVGTPNESILYLVSPQGGNIVQPAIIIFEEQDDSSAQRYEAIVVKMEGGGVSTDKVGVSDVITTWGKDAEFDELQVKSNTYLYKSADFWGTVITTDQTTSDSYTATISYPDNQVYANLYMAENAAVISGGSAVSSGSVKSIGSVIIADSEVSSASSKNLIVVGGSCINSVAASLLGGVNACSADFTTKTSVAANQFLIQTFSRTGGKVATLVAGYNAADTTNAAKFLTTQTVDTTVGKKYVGTSATQATVSTVTA